MGGKEGGLGQEFVVGGSPVQVPHPIDRRAKKPVCRKPCRPAGGLKQGCQKPVWRAQRAQPIPESLRAVFGLSKTQVLDIPRAKTTLFRTLPVSKILLASIAGPGPDLPLRMFLNPQPAAPFRSPVRSSCSEPSSPSAPTCSENV